ncbi:transposase [Idiomarina sp.]|uniref:transposase n=1 Tax=Idiomarina sp. TaxID=1874361 RepID=UPI003517D6A8
MLYEINLVIDIEGVDGVEKGKYRILKHFPNLNETLLFKLDNVNSLKKPTLVCLTQPNIQIKESTFQLPSFQIRDPQLVPAQHARLRDARWKLIKNLVDNDEFLLDYTLNGKSTRLTEHAKKHNTYVQKIYRALSLYWTYGQNLNALLPAYNNSGGKGIQRLAGQTSRGAPSKTNRFSNLKTVRSKNISDKDKELFSKAMKKYGFVKKPVPLSKVYRLMLLEFYTDEISASEKQQTPPSLPSMRAFRYWIKKLFSSDEISKGQSSTSYFERNHRGLRGSAVDNAEVPGSQFEIDATVLDVHIVSEFDASVCLGRPTLYVVIDKKSRMIVGIHLSLEYASWRAGRQALVNAFTSKPDYCLAFGLEIEEHEWPCHHIPQRLTCDRGEFICSQPEKLVVPLIGHISLSPPYRPDFKGIVERQFKILNDDLVHDLVGTTNGKQYVRGEKNPVLDARYTLKGVTRLLIDSVLERNNRFISSLSQQSELMIQTNTKPTPLNYWNLHLKKFRHSLRTAKYQEVRAQLLPPKRVSMTQKGIRLTDDLYYECDDPDFEKWKSMARVSGRWSLEARVDEGNVSNIYVKVRANQSFTKCTLVKSSSLFEGRHMGDIEYFEAWKSSFKDSNLPSLPSISRHDTRKSIIKTTSDSFATSRSTSANHKVSSLKENRRAAILESRNLSETEVLNNAGNNVEQTHTYKTKNDSTTLSILRRVRERKNER